MTQVSTNYIQAVHSTAFAYAQDRGEVVGGYSVTPPHLAEHVVAEQAALKDFGADVEVFKSTPCRLSVCFIVVRKNNS